MRVSFGVDQLGGDAEPVARPLDAAFKHIAHAQIAADLPGVDWLAKLSRDSGLNNAASPRRMWSRAAGCSVGRAASAAISSRRFLWIPIQTGWFRLLQIPTFRSKNRSTHGRGVEGPGAGRLAGGSRG
jgi:hypothetical protein